MAITSSSSSSPQSSTASYSQRQQNNKRSILLVDDEPDIIGIFKIDLEDNGFKVDAYIDPQKALSSFKAGIYDLVLIDLIMPKMNGYELCDKIKEIDSNVKVCFISATYVNYEAARQVFPGLEIECFIQKPIELQDLVRRINAELGL
jgi:two-component system catabolic regulation response regulator CreB